MKSNLNQGLGLLLCELKGGAVGEGVVVGEGYLRVLSRGVSCVFKCTQTVL